MANSLIVNYTSIKRGFGVFLVMLVSLVIFREIVALRGIGTGRFWGFGICVYAVFGEKCAHFFVQA